MNQSFKFIVNPSDTTEIEITSLLQYCALKNTLSEFTSNNINPFIYHETPVHFSNKVTDIDSYKDFAKYIQMTRSEKDAFKTKYLENTTNFSLFFDAISEIEYTEPFTDLRPNDNNNNRSTEYYIINDLYAIFMNHEYAKKYLSKYIPKNSEEVCYAEISDFLSNHIKYEDKFIKFYHHWFQSNDIATNDKGYTNLVKCIKENTDFQISKNNGHIENTCDDLCVYTEDPAIIHKVLVNNQAIIDKMANDISYINHRQHDNYSHRSIVFNELHTCITNVMDTCESIKKETEDNLTVLNDLIN